MPLHRFIQQQRLMWLRSSASQIDTALRVSIVV